MKAAIAVASTGAALVLFPACSDDSAPPGSGASAGTDGMSAATGSATMGAQGSGVGGAGATQSASATGTPPTTSASSAGGASSVSTSTDSADTSGAATGAGGSPVGIGEPLDMRLRVTTSTIPEGVHEGDNNWRIWGRGDLVVAPVFTVPLANCGTLVCFTTESAGTLTSRVAYLDASDALISTMTLDTGYECRGLAAEPDGNFAALLWDSEAERIFVARYDLTGTPRSAPTELVNSDNSPTEFGIGESRLEYGAGRYGAYYHVHSDSGHEGDTLKWVDTASGEEDTEWSWGCSHSMSNLLRFHPMLEQFLPVCVTDCYPGTGSGDFAQVSIGGIYLNHQRGKVMDVAAGCNGDVAGELGSAAFAPAGYKLVFNAHQAPATLGQQSYDENSMNQDIGFASIDSDLESSEVVWFTSTAEIDEADSSIARWQPMGDAVEQYVVGWSEPGSSISYKLARVDAAGNFLEGPIDVTAIARWGRRDDPFRQHVNGDVVWAWFDDAGSTSLNLARLSSGASASCAAF